MFLQTLLTKQWTDKDIELLLSKALITIVEPFPRLQGTSKKFIIDSCGLGLSKATVDKLTPQPFDAIMLGRFWKARCRAHACNVGRQISCEHQRHLSA